MGDRVATCALKGCLQFPLAEGELLFCMAHNPDNDYMWYKREPVRSKPDSTEKNGDSQLEKCAWECLNCGVLAATNVDATSEKTGVPCECAPGSSDWERRKDLEPVTENLDQKTADDTNKDAKR